MNWLAHTFLSENNIKFQIGNCLADSLKAKPWENASEDVRKAMKIHLLIDSYTDSNDIVVKSKKRLRKKGLLKSIVIDITYDYLLTKNWNRYCNISYENFTLNFYENAKNELEIISPKAQEVLNKIIKYKILNKYQNIDDLKIAFSRIDKRLSDKLLSRDNASSYFEAVKEHIYDLEKDFLQFFPQLCKFVKLHVDNSKLEHWKI